MSSRGWRSAVMGLALLVGPALPLITVARAAGAAETSFDETCADVYGHRADGDLDKTTDPVAGSPVAPGQEVNVTVKWPTFAVAGPRAHRIMECLSVDGHPAQLAADRQFTSDEGTVYKIAANGTFTTLYNFTGGTDGGFLYGTVDIDKDGNVYGSTVDGGANGFGTVFKLAPNGTLTTLYNFTGGTDGLRVSRPSLLAGTLTFTGRDGFQRFINGYYYYVLAVFTVCAAPGQLEAEDFGVVGGGQLEVGSSDVDVG